MMSRLDFDKFISGQKVQSEEGLEVFDSKQQLQEWREYLQQLYREIEKYMKSYINTGTAKLSYHDIELNEEFSGPYSVPEMSLVIGRSTITFKPVGTMLIGSKGRVDVQGPRGAIRLGLVNRAITHASQMISITVSVLGSPAPPEPTQNNKPIEWVWKIITPAPQMKFIDLTEDNFFDMILNVTDA